MAKHQSRDRRINVEPARLAAEVSSSNEWCTIKDRKTNFAYRSWGEPSHFSNAEKLIHGETFTQETFSPKNISYREKLLLFLFSQREGSAHRGFYTGKLSHPQWQQGICIPKTGSRCEKQKTILKTFFSHVTKDFKKGKSSAPMEKKKTYSCSHARYYCGTLTRPFHCDLHLFFRAVFFCWSPSDGLIWGACGLGNLTVPPSTQQRPTQKGMEGALKRQPWRSRGGPWNTTYPELGTGHCCRHPPPPPAAAHQQQWLLLRPGNRCGGVNAMVQHFPERTARSALDSLKCIELPPNEQLILNVFNHSSGDVFFLTILEGNHSRLSRVV